MPFKSSEGYNFCKVLGKWIPILNDTSMSCFKMALVKDQAESDSWHEQPVWYKGLPDFGQLACFCN